MAFLGVAITLEELDVSANGGGLFPPRHVNDRERHVSTFKFKQHVVPVNPSSDGCRLRAMQDCFGGTSDCSRVRKTFRTARNLVDG
jgi:hypothetical protein